MNEIITSGQQMLPETIEDLTQFVLVGKARLQSYMVGLRNVNKLSVAQEIRDQTLREAQELSNAVIAAEQRIGELLLAIPKASGMRTDIQTSSPHGAEVMTKTETVKDMGYSRKEASDYQQMAKHPEVVKKVIQDAMDNGEIVTKASVMREIKFYKDRIKALEEREPEVVEREVIPEDYEDLKKQLRIAESDAERLEADFQRARRQLQEKDKDVAALKAQLGADKVIRDADRDIRHFTIATHDYIRRYGGHVWSFEQLQNVNEDTRNDFIKAIKTLDGFAQQMITNMEGNVNG